MANKRNNTIKNKASTTKVTSTKGKSNIKISAILDRALHAQIKKFTQKNNSSINSLVKAAIKEYLNK